MLCVYLWDRIDDNQQQNVSLSSVPLSSRPPLTLTSSTFSLLLCSFFFSVKDVEMHLDGSVKSILHNPSVRRWFNKSISFIFRWNQEWNIPILESFPSLCCVFSPRCANAVYNAERCISQLASPPSHLLLCVHCVCFYTHVCFVLGHARKFHKTLGRVCEASRWVFGPNVTSCVE